MTIEKEVQLAVDMGIESALNFVYVAKVNYAKGYNLNGYYSLFNNKLLFISCLETGKDMGRAWFDWWSSHKHVDIKMLYRNPLLNKEIWDERTNEMYPPKYHIDKKFRINYELKLVGDKIGRLQKMSRYYTGDDKHLAEALLIDAYNDEEKLNRTKGFLNSGKTFNTIVLSDTKSYPILDLIKDYGFDPKATGNGRYKMLCPFHNEKTPSFVIFTDNNRYKCFGCQVGGDSIDFIMAYEKVSVMEAAKKLSVK